MMLCGSFIALNWLFRQPVLWASRRFGLHEPALPLAIITYAGTAALTIYTIWERLREERGKESGNNALK
jgi:hypothetical protein